MSGFKRPPVIVIGMHRCGTTLLLEMLMSLGFFAGAKLDSNMESVFFMRHNEWVLRRAGGSWDYPLAINSVHGSERLEDEAAKVFGRAVASRGFYEFTGALKTALFNSGRDFDGPWGWKDPRTVFTLGLWHRCFKGAKLLYIKRNGVDAANSLHVRERRNLMERGRHVFMQRSMASRLRASLAPIERYNYVSARCLTLRGSYDMWAEYAAAAEDAFDGFAGEKFAFRYEEMLKDGPAHIKAAADFCGLECDDAAIARAASMIKSARAYAFLSDPELRAFYNEIKNAGIMRRLGYDAIGA